MMVAWLFAGLAVLCFCLIVAVFTLAGRVRYWREEAYLYASLARASAPSVDLAGGRKVPAWTVGPLVRPARRTAAESAPPVRIPVRDGDRPAC